MKRTQCIAILKDALIAWHGVGPQSCTAGLSIGSPPGQSQTVHGAGGPITALPHDANAQPSFLVGDNGGSFGYTHFADDREAVIVTDEDAVAGFRLVAKHAMANGLFRGLLQAFQNDRLPELAAELVRRQVAVIVTTVGTAGHIRCQGGDHNDAALGRETLPGSLPTTVAVSLKAMNTGETLLNHVVGDRVLQTFATASTATLGADILFGRIGGEEFAALFPVGDLGEAYAVADRVRRNFIEAAARFANGGPAPTVSAGVTIGMQMKSGHANDDNGNSRDPRTSDPKTRVDTLLEVADRALYRAKANGRNRVEATAALEEMTASLACAPSIVPLIKAERLASSPARAWRRRATH